MRIPIRPALITLLRVAVVLIAFLGILTLCFFLMAPRLFKNKLETGISGLLHRRIVIRAVRFDPLLLEIEMGGITVFDRDGTPLLTVERALAHFERSSLSGGMPVLSRVNCVRPRLRLVREGPGAWNVTDILQAWSEGDGPPPFVLKALHIEDARVELLDRPSGCTLSLEAGTFWLPHLSSLPKDAGRPAVAHLTATLSGARVRASARWTPWADNPQGFLKLTFSGLDLYGPLRDLSMELPGEFAGGEMSGQLSAEVTTPDAGGTLATGRADLTLAPPASGGGTARQPSASLRGDGAWRLASGEALGRAEIDFPALDIPRLLHAYSLSLPLRITSGVVGGRLLARVSWSQKGRTSLSVSGDLKLSGLEIAEPGGPPVVDIPGTEIRLAESEPLSGRYALESMALERPRFHAEADWREQFARLARLLGTRNSGDDALPDIAIGRLRASDGSVLFRDLPSGGDLLTDLHGVELTLGPFSTAWAASPSFQGVARTAYGTRLGVSGEPRGATGPLEGTFEVEEFPLARAASLAPGGMPVTLHEGTADVSGRYRVNPSPEGDGISLSDARLSARSIGARSPSGAEFLAVPELELDGVEVDLDGRSARISRAVLRGCRLHLQRDAEGLWNILPPRGDDPASGAAPWSIAAGSLELEHGELRFADWSLDEPAELATQRIDLWACDLSSARCSTSALGFKVDLDGGGKVEGSGHAGLHPYGGQLDITLKEVPLALLQPYVSERMNVEVQEGSLSSSGHLTAGGTGDGSAPPLRYDGDLLLARFRIVDRERWEDLLVWDTLHLGGLTLSSTPPRVIVQEAALSDFYARAVILPDATLNLFHLWNPSPPDAPGGAAPSDPPTARFEEMVVQNGTVDFTDQFIRPSYSATLNELTGRLSGFDSTGGSAGTLELRGRLGGGAPLEIVGMANPFKKDLFADIRASCRGVDLLPFSAYAGKYAGYTIAGGKLDLEVTYRMEDRHLEAQSRIFLDQFALGEKVESEGTPDLPLKLAVSLLKNQRGEIRVEMPLSGSVDDLQLDFKPLVKKMFRGAVAKALASPFAFLGRIFRRGPKLIFVPFQAGRSEIAAGGMEAVATAGAKLAARPDLRVKIAGLFEPQADEEGLKKAILLRRVRAERELALRRQGKVAEASSGTFVRGEYERTLRAFFDRQEIPKPRAEDGLPKELSVEEMEKLLAAFTEVGLGDLRRLALDRAEAVRTGLLAAGARADQVYFVDEDSLPGADAAGPRTRATFALD